MFIAHKYRFYPTCEQAELLGHTFGCVRFIYNSVLTWREARFKETGKGVAFSEASRQVTVLKHTPGFEWLNEVSCDPLFQCIRDQQTAYRNFFKKRAGLPKYKTKKSRQSARFPASAIRIVNGELFMPKSKAPLGVRWSKPLTGRPMSMTISRDCAGRYFVSLLCEFNPNPLPIHSRQVGIDMGIANLGTTDIGEKFGNPRNTRKYEKRLSHASRRLSRMKLGSKNREKARLKVAKIHAKISDSRQDFLHKLSRRLINENQVICIETLAPRNMMKNRKLSKHIQDASWGELVRQLEYKSAWAGRDLVKIDRFFPSSKMCSECGALQDKLPLGVREWRCGCGAEHDRDVNAAKNIKAEGLSVLARGEGVRQAA